jgi:hypothetical protein
MIPEKKILDWFMYAVAILSAAISVLTIDQFGLQLVSGLALSLTALVALGALVRNRIYRRWYARMMFLDPKVLDEVSASYSLRPATEADMGQIAAHQAEWYAPADAIPKEILTEWFKANPNGFIIICDGNGDNIGHLDLLPIREKTLDLLKRGAIRERDVRGESLHPPEERALIADLWLESIVVTERNRHRRARVLLGIMRQAEQLLDRLADPDKLQNYYAIAATPAGDDLLSRLGFSKSVDVDARVDAHFLHQANSASVIRKVRAFAKRRSIPPGALRSAPVSLPASPGAPSSDD